MQVVEKVVTGWTGLPCPPLESLKTPAFFSQTQVQLYCSIFYEIPYASIKGCKMTTHVQEMLNLWAWKIVLVYLLSQISKAKMQKLF